jgi:thiosulfate/3-mercaptopyruvate sulfurtransferase
MTLFRSCLAGVGIVTVMALLVLANAAHGGEAYCDACKGDSGWSGDKALDQIGNPTAGAAEVMPGLNTAQKNRVGIWKEPLSGFTNGNTTKTANSAQNSSASVTEVPAKTVVQSKPVQDNTAIVRSTRAKGMLVPIEDVSATDILLDISENATEHIQGSVAIPYTEFMDNGSLLSVEEISKMLGDAGISRTDSVVVYGECMPCGGGPSPATYVYWMLKSMSHENVRVLDGTIKDWAAAGKPVVKETAIRPSENYTAQFTPDLIATYDYVLSGSAQIIDARTQQEFGNGSIPGSMNIPYESVITGNSRIKNETQLAKVFSWLNKNQPVVVYTNTGIKGSVEWFALELLGYDAKLYSYADYYQNNQIATSQGNASKATT